MSYKYAVLSDDGLSVAEYRTYPNPLDLATCKRFADGSLKVREVVETLLPVTDLQRSNHVVTIEPNRVVITNTVEDLPEDERKVIHNKKINDQILEVEQQALALGLLRTVMEYLRDRSISIAAASGITEAQLLDQSSPYYSPPYAKLHSNIKAREALRAQRL